MEEKVLQNKKNGMAALLLFLLLYIAAAACLGFGCSFMGGPKQTLGIVMIVAGGFWLLVGWIPFFGLTILKPQEALVLTLLGRYVGSLKSEGF